MSRLSTTLCRDVHESIAGDACKSVGDVPVIVAKNALRSSADARESVSRDSLESVSGDDSRSPEEAISTASLKTLSTAALETRTRVPLETLSRTSPVTLSRASKSNHDKVLTEMLSRETQRVRTDTLKSDQMHLEFCRNNSQNAHFRFPSARYTVGELPCELGDSCSSWRKPRNSNLGLHWLSWTAIQKETKCENS